METPSSTTSPNTRSHRWLTDFLVGLGGPLQVFRAEARDLRQQRRTDARRAERDMITMPPDRTQVDKPIHPTGPMRPRHAQ
jgi:hypothetical protein